MAYDSNTYKKALDCYLTSGIKYLRYVRKRMGNTMIFYPIINDAQIKSFVTDHIYREGKTTTFDNAKPYSDWYWFQSNYDIVGLKELDVNVTASYFVLVVGSMAALINLSSSNYDIERLNDKSIYDIQAYFLLNSSKRIGRSGNHFYRYSYNHGRFEYDKKRLPFKQMIKIAIDREYTSDRIFVDYIQQVSIDEVDSLLQLLLGRYIRGCKGTDKDISKNDWLNHTKALFGIQDFGNAQQEEVRKKVIGFCDNQTQTATAIHQANQIMAHYAIVSDNYKPPFFEKLYDVLIQQSYIDAQTSKSDFMFYFCGIGANPTRKIKWKGSKVQLAILISKLHAQNTITDWKTTEVIFEDVKGSNLKKAYNNCKDNSKSTQTVKQLIGQAL